MCPTSSRSRSTWHVFSHEKDLCWQMHQFIRLCYMPCRLQPILVFRTLDSILCKPCWLSPSDVVDLLVILIRLVVDNVEEAELVDTLGGGNDAEQVTELLLLEELLSTTIAVSAIHPNMTQPHLPLGGGLRKYIQVLQVAAGELLVRNHLDLAIALLADLDGVAKVTGAALDLDAVVEELLESLDVEDLVVDGLRAVDDELLGDLLALLGGGAALL